MKYSKHKHFVLVYMPPGFLRPTGLSAQSAPFPTVKSSCRIESFGPFGAGNRVFFPAIFRIFVSLDIFVLSVRMYPPSRRITGTLFAGDGVVIQQSSRLQGPSCGSCSALLRYPRSSFGAGNLLLCVIFTPSYCFLIISLDALLSPAACGVDSEVTAICAVALMRIYFDLMERSLTLRKVSDKVVK